MRAGGVVLEAVRGDITEQDVEVVVNAANASLLGGGGVDGAIHAAAGPALLDACRRVRREQWPLGLPTGEAVATEAGDLPARWVVHTVGPDRRAGETDPALLASCFTRSLDVAAGLGATTVAVPAVGAGVFGWAAQEAADVAVKAVVGWAARHEGPVRVVRFVLFGEDLLTRFRAALAAATAEGGAR